MAESRRPDELNSVKSNPHEYRSVYIPRSGEKDELTLAEKRDRRRGEGALVGLSSFVGRSSGAYFRQEGDLRATTNEG